MFHRPHGKPFGATALHISRSDMVQVRGHLHITGKA
jgi:hypothetical protein